MHPTYTYIITRWCILYIYLQTLTKLYNHFLKKFVPNNFILSESWGTAGVSQILCFQSPVQNIFRKNILQTKFIVLKHHNYEEDRPDSVLKAPEPRSVPCKRDRELEKKMLSAFFFDATGNRIIGATIRIGWEIWCPPYVGFLKLGFFWA